VSGLPGEDIHRLTRLMWVRRAYGDRYTYGFGTYRPMTPEISGRVVTQWRRVFYGRDAAEVDRKINRDRERNQ
jgi:hypothetical protein